MANDWQMPRPGSVCALCAHEFEPGEAFAAYLYESAEAYERRDYCADCTPPAEPKPIGTWRTRRPLPTAKKVTVFDREAIYAFFRRLDDADEPEKVQFRFVLALLLWRKKVLQFSRSVKVDGRELWEFSQRGTDESHRVERPDLAEDELERLSMQLEHLLTGAPAEPDPAPAGQEEPTNG